MSWFSKTTDYEKDRLKKIRLKARMKALRAREIQEARFEREKAKIDIDRRLEEYKKGKPSSSAWRGAISVLNTMADNYNRKPVAVKRNAKRKTTRKKMYKYVRVRV